MEIISEIMSRDMHLEFDITDEVNFDEENLLCALRSCSGRRDGSDG